MQHGGKINTAGLKSEGQTKKLYLEKSLKPEKLFVENKEKLFLYDTIFIKYLKEIKIF